VNDYSIIFYDLDETLYPASSGVWEAIAVRINAYMRDRLALSEAEIPEIRHGLYLEYGTTMRGLEALYGIDSQDYLQYVHDIPLHELITPDQRLRQLIASYPQRRIILTNADVPHAQRVLRVLDLEGCFEQIIDVVAVSPYCKPQPEAFLRALEIAGEPDPSRCILIDDKPKNLASARQLGFYTILVGQNGDNPDSYHRSVQTISELASVLDPLLAR
jgi:pyrimidine 5'-nucleotidase